MYMQFAIDIGMIVRCCREYESISIGCEGKVIKFRTDGGLHDLNVKVLFIFQVYVLINNWKLIYYK